MYLDIRRRFRPAISAWYEVFAINSFRKYDTDGYETRFNRAVFEIIVYYFANDAHRRAALTKNAKVKAAYEAGAPALAQTRVVASEW